MTLAIWIERFITTDFVLITNCWGNVWVITPPLSLPPLSQFLWISLSSSNLHLLLVLIRWSNFFPKKFRCNLFLSLLVRGWYHCAFMIGLIALDMLIVSFYFIGFRDFNRHQESICLNRSRYQILQELFMLVQKNLSNYINAYLIETCRGRIRFCQNGKIRDNRIDCSSVFVGIKSHLRYKN